MGKWRALAAEPFLDQLPATVAEDLTRAVGRDFYVTRRWRGTGSVAYLLEFPAGSKPLVFKCPHNPRYYGPERAALELPGIAALSGCKLLPEVSEILPGDSGHLTEFIRHPRFYDAASRRPITVLARQLAEGLATYHLHTGVAMGDLHPLNVLVREGGVTFIDPAFPPSEAVLRESHPLVADLAMWVAQTVSRLPLHAVRRPRWALRCLSFDAEFLHQALVSQPGGLELLDQVFERANACLHKWLRRSTVRNRLAYRPSLLALRLLERKARRRLNGVLH